MNKLEYLASGIIGNLNSFKKLSVAKTASLLLISDTHGSASILENIFLKYGETIDAVLFSGDGLVDFIHILEEASITPEFKNCLPSLFFYVMGNSDCYRNNLQLKKANEILTDNEQCLEKKIVNFPDDLFIQACGRQILLTHGHNYFVEYDESILGKFAQKNNCDFAVYGHTHFPLCEKLDKVTLINPGSPQSPRRGAEKSFAILNLHQNGSFELDWQYLKS